MFLVEDLMKCTAGILTFPHWGCCNAWRILKNANWITCIWQSPWQTIWPMKSGIMEIADIFVVNKCDREGADYFATNLQKMLHDQPAKDRQVPVLKTSASQKQGIEELAEQIEKHSSSSLTNEKKIFLLTEKAYRLIAKGKMKNISRMKIREDIRQTIPQKDFNLYRYVRAYLL